MTGGKQHRRNSQHLRHALLPQFFQPITQDGLGEFKKAVFNRQVGQSLLESPGQPLELFNRQTIATAMTTDQHTMFRCDRSIDLQGHSGGASLTNLFAAREQNR